MDKVLFGRVLDPQLDAHGEWQARALGRFLQALPDLIVQSSPRLRARQTAAAIADRHDTGIQTVADMDEVDFGTWGGQQFTALAADARWRHWNERRGSACTPAGETIAAVQARAVDHLHHVHEHLPGSTVAIVTHAEIIRSVLLYCKGAPADDYVRFEIAPASLTSLEVTDGGVAVATSDERVRA